MQRLWVMGGGFDLPSQALLQFAVRLGGALVYPEGQTCPAGIGSTVDYFIVHQKLADVVRVV